MKLARVHLASFLVGHEPLLLRHQRVTEVQLDLVVALGHDKVVASLRLFLQVLHEHGLRRRIADAVRHDVDDIPSAAFLAIDFLVTARDIS